MVLLTLVVTVATMIGLGMGVGFASLRSREAALWSGFLALAVMAAVKTGQTLHDANRPVAPPECYTTVLGSTTYCTGAQRLNLIEGSSWTAAALFTAALVALVLSVSIRVVRARLAPSSAGSL